MGKKFESSLENQKQLASKVLQEYWKEKELEDETILGKFHQLDSVENCGETHQINSKKLLEEIDLINLSFCYLINIYKDPI